MKSPLSRAILTMPSLTTFLELAALAAVAVAIPTDNSTILGSRTETAKRATCTVNSVASAANLSACTAVIITAFTVPAGSEYRDLCSLAIFLLTDGGRHYYYCCGFYLPKLVVQN